MFLKPAIPDIENGIKNQRISIEKIHICTAESGN